MNNALRVTAPDPMLENADPNAEKLQQYIGIGGVIVGALGAAWARLRYYSKSDIERIVDERLEHQALMKMLEKHQGGGK